MPDAARRARIESVGDGLFKVHGPLTFATALRTCQAGISAFADGGPAIQVDCAQVTGVDSAGVAVLIEWRRWAHGIARSLQFINLPPTVLSVARISGIETVLGVGAA